MVHAAAQVVPNIMLLICEIMIIYFDKGHRIYK